MLEIHHWCSLDEAARGSLLRRPSLDRAPEVEARVAGILERVRRDGDAALRALTLELDGVESSTLRVDAEEISRAARDCPRSLLEAMADARDNIAAFHRAQLARSIRVETTRGVTCERLVRPLQSVGLYVPAGGAPLLSSLLMMAVPAALARCPRRALCTPPRASGRPDPFILAAADLCGIEEIYCVGGPQAIAALAYGTESVLRVDKIFGPGNAWVAAAKSLVSRDPEGADSDLVAGPTELVVVADGSAEAELVAADLLAQAEHGPDSQVLLISDREEVARSVALRVDEQLTTLARASIAERSLASSAAIVVEELPIAFEVVNAYAPEHLALHVRSPRDWLDRIHSAGSVFLGRWTPEALGDYCSGTNHVLPTGGLARTRGGLGVADFQKAITVQEATPEGLRRLGAVAARLAQAEELEAHRRSVELRLERLDRGA